MRPSEAPRCTTGICDVMRGDDGAAFPEPAGSPTEHPSRHSTICSPAISIAVPAATTLIRVLAMPRSDNAVCSKVIAVTGSVNGPLATARCHPAVAGRL